MTSTRYYNFLKQGLCPNCGRRRSDDNWLLCNTCRRKLAEYRKRDGIAEQVRVATRKRYWRRRKSGHCVDCGDFAHGFARCDICRVKHLIACHAYLKRKRVNNHRHNGLMAGC